MPQRKSDQAAEAIIETAQAVALECGVGTLSARTVAQRAGLSPSAVNYHLGGREGLIRALWLRIRDEFQRWSEARRDSLTTLPPDLVSLPALVASLVGDLAAQPWALAMAEFREIHGRAPDLAEAGDLDWLSMESFWKQILERLETPDHARQAWHIFALGALSLALVDADPAVRAVWLARAAHRLAKRLAGARRFEPSHHEDAGLPVIDRLEQADGRRRIIETSIRLIGERGVADLTHREVAAAAGLSLASTTYFFKSKNEIVIEAFRELHRRVFERLASSTPRPMSSLSNLLLTKAGDPHWEVGAMSALYTAAAREQALRPFALDLRRIRGIGSLRWLPTQGVVGADRTDGFIWSLIIGGLFQAALLLPKRRRRAFLDRTSKQLLESIFLGTGRDPAAKPGWT